jgi:Tfp pilus assembly protein PilO
MQQELDKNIKAISQPKYLNVLGVIIFLAISIAVYLVAENLTKEVNNKKIQADTKESEIELRLSNIEKFKDLKRNVPDFPDKVEILDNIKNEQQSLEQLISQLEKIANVAGVIMPSISPDATVQSSMQASIVLSGDYASVKKFLNGIENNQLILNISDISISGEEPTLAVILTLRAGI